MMKITGLYLIPCDKHKRPRGKWKSETPIDHNFSPDDNVALVAGKVSGFVECIDIDTKYDLTGTLAKDFFALVKQNQTLFDKLVIQRTRSGGYHVIYRATNLEGNKKLASRETLPEERENPNDKVRVLVETRGEGGYFLIEPSEGYKVMKGSLSEIQVLTPEERNEIISIGKSFNQVFKQAPVYKAPERRTISQVSPFDDYNERGDVLDLLQSEGWKITGQRGKNVLIKRAGKSDSTHSASFCLERKILYVFSTSTQFEAEQGYNPVQVYTVLKHNGDFSAASKALYEQGYGERIESAIKPPPVKISKADDDFSFLVSEKELEKDVMLYRLNKHEQGLTTGSERLDKYFKFKRKQFNGILAHDNVGKTTGMMYLAALSSIYHNWRWVIYTTENEAGECKKMLMEFYLDCKISEMTQKQYEAAVLFTKQHFYFINRDNLYNYKDLLNICEKIKSKTQVDGMIIDPYNSLERSEKMNGHDWDYKVLSEIKAFTGKFDVTVFLLYHVYTAAARLREDRKPVAPDKQDGEGGQKFANKMDDFLVFHRDTQDPQNYRNMEIHVRKIKRTATGGQVTPRAEPVILTMNKTCTGYEDENGINPVKEYHINNKTGLIDTMAEILASKPEPVSLPVPNVKTPIIDYTEPTKNNEDDFNIEMIDDDAPF